MAIGLGSMVGAGVFAVWAPAAQAAGAGLLIGLVVAGVVAYCNAASSAQLAAVYPVAGGTYVYGRERLGEWWGFSAGWCFVLGKTASCAAMAITFATYAVPGGGWPRRLVAAAAVVALAAVNYRGITRTARVTRVLVACTLAVLLLVLVVLWSSGDHSTPALTDTTPYGVLQSAGLLFFAFAGYARIATLGEEVRDPGRTIPRAVTIALVIAMGIYLVMAVTLLVTVGADQLSTAVAPLSEHAGWAAPAVRVGAALASLGALLALMTGVGRTTLAMARNRDLPTWLAAVHPLHQAPHHAELALGVVLVVLVLTVDLRGVIGFSSFGVLLYYAVANLSALTQPAEQRRWPRAISLLGLIGCVTLAATLPWTSIVPAVALLVLGLAGRFVIRRSPAGSARS